MDLMKIAQLAIADGAQISKRIMQLYKSYDEATSDEQKAEIIAKLASDGVHLAPRTIDRIIQREGRTRRDVAPTAAGQRFERAAANDLWQMDAKGAYPLAPGGRCHPLSILDDHSRYAVGLYALPALSTALVQPALIACFRRYGVPRAMLMDHGTPRRPPTPTA